MFAPHHLSIGAAVVLVGDGLAVTAATGAGAAAMLAGAVVAVDDLFHHAFGTTTPLDQLWRRVARKHLT